MCSSDLQKRAVHQHAVRQINDEMFVSFLHQFSQQRFEIRAEREVGAARYFHAREISADQYGQFCRRHCHFKKIFSPLSCDRLRRDDLHERLLQHQRGVQSDADQPAIATQQQIHGAD